MTTIVDPDLPPTAISIYNAIREAWVKFETCPSRNEIRYAVGCSTPYLNRCLQLLEAKGHITREHYRSRSIRLVDLSRRLARKPVDPWDEDLDTPQIWL